MIENSPNTQMRRSADRAGVTVLDDSRVLLQCTDCRQKWSPMIQTGGKLRRGWRRCPHGCNKNKLSQ